MQLRSLGLFLLASLLPFSAAAACSSDDTSNPGTGGGSSGDPTSTSTDTSSSGPGSGGSSSSGMGGEGVGGGAGGSGATGGTGGTGSGGGAVGDHLLISELASTPGPAEFVEIYNPTATKVDLTDYYLSDNSTYVGIASGKPWNPTTTNLGTDFLVRFPAGSGIDPGAAIVIATSPEFEATYNKCPDYILAADDLPCLSGSAKAMLVPTNGGVDPTKAGAMLSNEREMVVLFTWSGMNTDLLQDVDYLTWGDMFEAGSRADKTAEAGYKPDTAPAMQKGAPAPANFESIERCGPNLENAEKTSGGNGITGHDETSEDLGTSFKAQATPTPGVKNACL